MITLAIAVTAAPTREKIDVDEVSEDLREDGEDDLFVTSVLTVPNESKNKTILNMSVIKKRNMKRYVKMCKNVTIDCLLFKINLLQELISATLEEIT